ncbi:MAG: GIY-YIG nuclease family protein [Proteobacteria bacterium]|nr:GIY-YIG nuclease family protein [Pseudomonadota bacterium]NIS72543.1 GIY-YIG nuclease family protein [Pseudomonadota bacterium]
MMWYVGSTTDLDRRIEEHDSGSVRKPLFLRAKSEESYPLFCK